MTKHVAMTKFEMHAETEETKYVVSNDVVHATIV